MRLLAEGILGLGTTFNDYDWLMVDTTTIAVILIIFTYYQFWGKK
jgi:hypothetical protein